METYEQGIKVVIVLDDNDDDCGVYPTLERAMDYIADWSVPMGRKDHEAYRDKLRVSIKALETTYGWVVECGPRSYKALRSALRS